MRVVLKSQTRFGEGDIAEIITHPKTRDEIDITVLALQYIYTTPEVRESIFKIFEDELHPKVSKKIDDLA